MVKRTRTAHAKLDQEVKRRNGNVQCWRAGAAGAKALVEMTFCRLIDNAGKLFVAFVGTCLQCFLPRDNEIWWRSRFSLSDGLANVCEDEGVSVFWMALLGENVLGHICGKNISQA